MPYKERVLSLLNNIQRNGVNDLAEFLTEKSDFLTAPASTAHHLAVPSGLVTHTLNVVECAICLNSRYNIASHESIVIASLCHDLCKVNYYTEIDEPPTDRQMNYLKSLLRLKGLPMPPKLNKAFAGDVIGFLKNDFGKPDKKMPEYRLNYEVSDQLPLGHGEKSLFMTNQFIFTTLEESLAIRWHMGPWDLNLTSAYQRYAYNDAVKKTKLVTLLAMADTEATQLIEGE